MKQRKRRITAAVLSAAMAVTAVTMLPAGQSFAANITAKEFYQTEKHYTDTADALLLWRLPILFFTARQ